MKEFSKLLFTITHKRNYNLFFIKKKLNLDIGQLLCGIYVYIDINLLFINSIAVAVGTSQRD